jgi:hypothetical protein
MQPVEQVIDQASRRVLGGEQVPAADKIVSLSEPSTDIIRCGKAGPPTGFGHKVWLDETGVGLSPAIVCGKAIQAIQASGYRIWSDTGSCLTGSLTR